MWTEKIISINDKKWSFKLGKESERNFLFENTTNFMTIVFQLVVDKNNSTFTDKWCAALYSLFGPVLKGVIYVQIDSCNNNSFLSYCRTILIFASIVLFSLTIFYMTAKVHFPTQNVESLERIVFEFEAIYVNTDRFEAISLHVV